MILLINWFMFIILLRSRIENNILKIGIRFINVIVELEDNLCNLKLYNKKVIIE